MRPVIVAALIALTTSAFGQEAPTTELSKSGSTIYRYGEPPTTALDADNYEVVDPDAIEAFLRPLLGDYVRLRHELQSELVHLDVLFFPPKVDRPYWTLVTSGMSGRPMLVPEIVGDTENFAYAELVMSFPEGWIPRDGSGGYDFEFFEGDGSDWPVRELLLLARFPHLHRTWLGAGHSVTNDTPPRPIVPETRMDGYLVEPPTTWPARFHQMTNDKGKSVRFLALLPIYPEEMQFKLDTGTDPLLDRLRQGGVTEVLNLKRDSVVGTTAD